MMGQVITDPQADLDYINFLILCLQYSLQNTLEFDEELPLFLRIHEDYEFELKFVIHGFCPVNVSLFSANYLIFMKDYFWHYCCCHITTYVM